MIVELISRVYEEGSRLTSSGGGSAIEFRRHGALFVSAGGVVTEVINS